MSFFIIEMDKAKAEIDRLRAELANRDARLQKSLLAVAAIEDELSEARADNAAKDTRIQELEVAIGIIIKERDEANFAGAELREKLEKPLNFQWETGGAELAAKDARIAELEAYHTNCTDYINQLLGNIADDDKERVAILARAEQAEEQAHYANGVADLAMKHRDSAEASLLYEATETRIAMEQLQDRAERAEARIAELEANAVETELEWSKLCAERERAIIARAELAAMTERAEKAEDTIGDQTDLEKDLADCRAELADAKAALTKYGDQGAFQALRDANARIAELEDKLSTAVWSRDHERADNEALHKRIAELEATILHWTSEVTRLERNCDDDQDRAERAEDALKEQLQWKKSYTERAERAEAALKAYQQDYKAVHSITELREVRAERDSMLLVCVGVDAVASIEEEIGFSKDWTPMWRDTVTRARAALAPSPAGREG